jgi:GNAT superfamily N-acetyltransferase
MSLQLLSELIILSLVKPLLYTVRQNLEKTMPEPLTLRDATISDTFLIVSLIKELAAYEKLSHECHASEALIEQWLFGTQPRAKALIAEWNGAQAGFALYFYNFSTFLSKPGIYIEDIFVRPEYRRKGIAQEIFRFLACKAVKEGCGRLEWWVLDWNQEAINFYQTLHAKPMDEWTVQRIEGDALIKLANGTLHSGKLTQNKK